MALTGTPLIADIEDLLAIWEFLGGIDDSETGPRPPDRRPAGGARQWAARDRVRRSKSSLPCAF